MEKAEKLGPANWSHCELTQGELRAFISYGGEPSGEEPFEIKELYFVILMQGSREEGLTLWEKPFNELDEALSFIQGRYGHFSFKDLSQKEEGGCSSCVAH